ncbi:antibiotic ABC transporter ATP-binding protein [Polaribacter pacificus]|uniref:Antibiotic ABC transporter ATP-binding protein n=1 Tax=Polaribacter pacificus TaxID=1775173 RepID=A0A917I1T5_9FLAO|nr:ABC transporter ATP-binding protein [Polaribacter pacificus]GGH02107.1 antibiotic ABC transporter ATP-binding protein [Polaribacter pacificus]
MNYFKKILRFAKPYRKYAILNAISNVFYALFSTLSFVAFIPMLNVLFKQSGDIISIKPIYDSATGVSGYKEYLEQSLNFFLNQEIAKNGEIAALGYICGTMILLFFLKNIANYAALFFITFLRNGIIRDIRNALYNKLVTLPISYFTEKRKGDVIARMTSDVQEVEWSFLMVLELIIRDPLTIIFTLIAMISISAKLTLFIFIFLPLAGLIIGFIGKRLKADSDVAQKENGFFLSLIEETLTGLRVIKGFTAEKQFTGKFQNSTNKLFRTMNSLMNKKNLASPTSEFLGVSVIVIILWYGGKMVLIDETITGGAFIGFMALAYNILTPSKSISNAIYGIKKGDASAQRVLELLETENTISDKENAQTKTSFNSEIIFDNISFKYKDEYVLKDFSLTIPKGKTVALVGQSGSGKSTLANLITRFYDVNEGAIYIDGINIKDISKNSLRKMMGIVTQDSILFNDSVSNNIALGTEESSEEAIIEAAKIANAHEFIKDLPNQYEFNIGDSGNLLSGGQKQRLSIARAVLKNPPIMVLDEATSALDTESEQLVQLALEKMMQNRTSLVIAHRLSTIQKADTIVVLRKGKIIEQGKHDDLMQEQGDYFKLVSMQSL